MSFSSTTTKPVIIPSAEALVLAFATVVSFVPGKDALARKYNDLLTTCAQNYEVHLLDSVICEALKYVEYIEQDNISRENDVNQILSYGGMCKPTQIKDKKRVARELCSLLASIKYIPNCKFINYIEGQIMHEDPFEFEEKYLSFDVNFTKYSMYSYGKAINALLLIDGQVINA